MDMRGKGDGVNSLAQEIGERIRSFRLARGMKQAALAAEVGYRSHAAIAQFENGFALPSIEKFLDISRVLGVHPGELLEDVPREKEYCDAWLVPIKDHRDTAPLPECQHFAHVLLALATGYQARVTAS